MFFTKAVVALALTVSALAMRIPRAGSHVDAVCGSSAVSSAVSSTVSSTASSTAETSTASTSTAVASDDPSWLTGTQTGEGTYYETGLGACGIDNTDSDYIVAVSEDLFDNYPGYTGSNPNDNPVCNKQITASYNGNSVTVTVTDRCTGCATTDLDFSPSAFEQLADLSQGRLYGVTWDWS